MLGDTISRLFSVLLSVFRVEQQLFDLGGPIADKLMDGKMSVVFGWIPTKHGDRRQTELS